jgi:hypothetical protein
VELYSLSHTAPTWRVTAILLTFIQCVSFVFILNNAAVTGYLRGCRYPARINYPVQRRDKNRLFEVGSFVVCSFAARKDIVCHREPQYILVAHCTLVSVIYFVVGEYFSYT